MIVYIDVRYTVPVSYKETLSITEARKRIFDIASSVQAPGSYCILTDKGRPKAVMVSVDEFEALLEALDMLEYFPNFAKDVKQAEQELARGEVYSLQDVLAEEGFVVADAPDDGGNADTDRKDDESDISGTNHQKRSKGS